MPPQRGHFGMGCSVIARTLLVGKERRALPILALFYKRCKEFAQVESDIVDAERCAPTMISATTPRRAALMFPRGNARDIKYVHGLDLPV